MTLRLATAGAILALAAGLPRAEAQYQRDQLPSGVALERVGLERHWHNTVPMGLGSERLLRITPAASSQTVNGTVNPEVLAAGGFTAAGDLLPIDGLYNNWRMKFLDGPLAGQSRVVASYRGGDRQFTFTAPWPAAPEAGSRFALLDTMLFAQTNNGLFYAFDAETGQRLWSANLGQPGTQAFPASVNSRAVFVTTANLLIALDRGSGRPLWREELSDYPSSPTACDEDLVTVGLQDGRLEAFHLLRGNVPFKSDLKTYAVPGAGAADTKAQSDRFRDLAYLKEPLLAWVYKTDRRMTSRPLLAGDVISFASGAGLVYTALSSRYEILYRFATGGAVTAPLASYGVRTLLVSSMDRNVYALDLFTGATKWSHATGAPIAQEPLVAGEDIFVQNTAGRLSVLDPETGEARWTTETRGGTLLAVGQARVYLKTAQGDLFVVDRKSGQILDDPRSTSLVKGLNLRSFTLTPTNQLNDRIFLATPEGSIVCIREAGRTVASPLRDPGAVPFGYIPPEGYPEDNPPPTAPANDPFGLPGDDFFGPP